MSHVILKTMRILGIDPGTATTGYGFIEVNGDITKPKLLDFGWISTEKDGVHGQRLQEIFKQMKVLLGKLQPDVVAIESLFFYNNAKTAMRVGQANGVILLAVAQSGIQLFEYPPARVKLTVGGSGRADKVMMKKMVRQIFKVRSPKKKKTHFDDVADAIAIAYCHAVYINLKS